MSDLDQVPWLIVETSQCQPGTLLARDPKCLDQRGQGGAIDIETPDRSTDRFAGFARTR